MALPAPARPAPVRPSGWWYVAPALLLAAAGVMAVMSLTDGFRQAQRTAFDANLTAAGESQVLSIAEPGGYTIAYVGPVIVSDDVEKEELAEELAVSIVDSGSGVPIPVLPYEGYRPQEDVDPNLGPIQYVPLRTVRFDEAGEYSMSSRRSFRLDRESVLVVSESPYRRLRDGLERAIWVLVIGTFLAVLGTVILAVNRGRAKKAARAQLPVIGPGPPVGWGAPPPPWGAGPPPGAYGSAPGAPGPPGAPGGATSWGPPPGAWSPGPPDGGPASGGGWVTPPPPPRPPA